MTIAVYLDESHFRQFLIFNIIKRLKLHRRPVVFASIFTISAIICFLMYRVEGALLLGTVLLVSGLGMPLVYFASFFVSLKKQVRLQNLNPPRLVYTLEFSEESDMLEISNGKERATYRWQDVLHAYCEKGSIYLFITKERAFLLPGNLLADTNRVWKIISAKLPVGDFSKHG